MHFENDIGTLGPNIPFIIFFIGVLKIEFKVLQHEQLVDKYPILQSIDQENIWLSQLFHHKVFLIHNHNTSGKLFKSFHHNHELLETI